MKSPFGIAYFQGYVSFGEGIHPTFFGLSMSSKKHVPPSSFTMYIEIFGKLGTV